jgi:hypothetical protein
MIEGFQVFQPTRNHWTTGPHGFAVRTARHFTTGFDDVVHVAADLMTRRSLAAPLVGTKFWAHGEQSALPTPLAPNAAASTASPARERDDHKIAPQE